MLYYERKLKNKGCGLIIGVDEVGRGPLAGPVVAAAVVLKQLRFKNRIDDSKKLTPKARERAFPELIEKTVFGVGIVNEKIIDAVNIEVATRMAMDEAIQQLLAKLKSAKDPAVSNTKRSNRPRRGGVHILVDGNIRLSAGFPYTNIIKGDSKSKSIASASILAKVIRDRIMSLYDRIYPQYGFREHKGYPTKKHRAALRKFGPSLIHRMSFSCV